jgi:predicted N-formylglutamate amidohydrolase
MGELMVIVTCEHASNKIPPVYTPIISDKEVLKTHEGYDIGALSYAKILACLLSAPLFVGSFSRLLVDVNRSPSNRHLFSRYTMQCSAAEKKAIVQKYYEPFRQKVFAAVDHELKQGHRVLHLSCHSFTPQLGRQIRTMDLGILYDPDRMGEVEFSNQLFERLQSSTSIRIRKNAPYRGNSDGHVAYLRRHFKPDRYLGIELEINQALFVHTSPADIWKYVWLPALCREVLSICNGYQ